MEVKNIEVLNISIYISIYIHDLGKRLFPPWFSIYNEADTERERASRTERASGSGWSNQITDVIWSQPMYCFIRSNFKINMWLNWKPMELLEHGCNLMS